MKKKKQQILSLKIQKFWSCHKTWSLEWKNKNHEINKISSKMWVLRILKSSMAFLDGKTFLWVQKKPLSDHRSEYLSDLHEIEIRWSWEILFSKCNNFGSENLEFLGNFDIWSWDPYYVTEPTKNLAPPVARYMIFCGSDEESYFALAIKRVCRNVGCYLL